MLRKLLPAVCFFVCQSLFAQQNTLYNPSIDVQHYVFQAQVSDANDSLKGRALITVRFSEKVKTVSFDLVNVNDTGRGMIVTAVEENGKKLVFTHQKDVLQIALTDSAAVGTVHTYTIEYKGIPADGLIISKNKFGRRTFFSDHWPNRAHYWLPCKDHLSDKASVEFVITAPDHYKVVSNGVKTKETVLPQRLRRTHWIETVPLPTKVMAVGIADLAITQAGEVNGIPVASWVYPENKEQAFTDYAQATEILPFFIERVGAYPYHKLANVQSKTIFGGMENAGAIFYAENMITGKREMEALLTHEIAHQWFGNSATETDWPHLWLSEGFATAMTHLYMEQKHGRDSLVRRMEKDRKEVLAFTKIKKAPVVDTLGRTRPMTMLNAHSYQKGGWVLLMLRNLVGNDIFWKAVRTYYATYQGKNASTEDLQKVFETVSGKSLQTFFKQWLYRPENPNLLIIWHYHAPLKQIDLTITQQTLTDFSLELELERMDEKGNKIRSQIPINQKNTILHIAADSKPLKVTADPDSRMLMEAAVKEIR
jgi:aminopeptidase N